MKKEDAVTAIADALNIEREDAAELITEYACNAGEVETVDQVETVTERRVAEIISDRLAFIAEHVPEPVVNDTPRMFRRDGSEMDPWESE